ncbi:phosphotransferase enzyme family protein [Peribacillus deserti]|nr:phosphotransferase [Peribacillus deserti]
MHLSTMKKVVGTVNSEWKSNLAEKLLEPWGFDHGSVYYIRASANFIFTFKKQGIRYYLRFNESSERTEQEIKSELKILIYLRNQGVSSVNPVKSNNRNYVEFFETEYGRFYAVVFEAMPGRTPDLEELTSHDFWRWGRALGKLHKHMAQLPKEYVYDRKGPEEAYTFIRQSLGIEDTLGLCELEKIKQDLAELVITEQNFGCIHFDFELDNLAFTDADIWMMDFDDCMNFWFAGDIVFALRDFNPLDTSSPFFTQFLEGYQSEFNLEPDFLHHIKTYQRFHDLFTYARIIRSLDITDDQENPEWLINLQNKLLIKADQYRASFKKYESCTVDSNRSCY